jgi:hypothetical protein
MTKAKDRLFEYTAKQKADNEELDVGEASTIITNTVIDVYEVVVNTLNSGQARFHLQDMADNGMEELLEEEFGTYNSNDAIDAIQSDIKSSYNREWKLEWIECKDGSGGLGFEIAGEKILVDKLVDTDGNVQVSHIVEQSDYETQDIDELLSNELYADSLRSPNISMKYTEKDTYSELLEQYLQNYQDNSEDDMDIPTPFKLPCVVLYTILIWFVVSLILYQIGIHTYISMVVASIFTSILGIIFILNFDSLIPRYKAYMNRSESVVRESLYSVPEE